MLDGNDIWEALFGILKGNVPDAMSEDVCEQLANALSPAFLAAIELGREACSETGWLIEENFGGEFHWLALVDGHWPRTKVRQTDRKRDIEIRQFVSPVRRVKDASEALRFARKEDAEAFIALFCRFISIGGIQATEHEWPAIERGDHHPAGSGTRAVDVGSIMPTPRYKTGEDIEKHLDAKENDRG